MLSVFFALVVAVTIAFILQNIIKPRNYPPGPRWYPFLGCGHLVENLTRELGSQWKCFTKLSKEYNTDVLGLKLGREMVIVVFGEKHIRHIFTEKEFEGRPDTFFLRLRCFGKRLGITFTDGPLWREHRQFTMKNLKNVGFGKTVMEKEIQEETRNILQKIKSNNLGVSPQALLAPAVLNTLWRYVSGERIHGDDYLKYILNLMYLRSKAFTIAGGWLNQIPWCRFIFPKWTGYSLIQQVNREMSDLIDVLLWGDLERIGSIEKDSGLLSLCKQEVVYNHSLQDVIQKHVEKKVQGNDFIYAFLKEMEDGIELYTVEQLKVICLDLFIAGSQTTSNVVEFALLTALRNKQMQEKVYEEINRVLGDEMPSWTDIYKLPYTAAFLLEVQRYYTIVPIAGPRRVLSETTINGYCIPKGSTILIALAELHFDADYWDEPYTFKPERFLNEKGNFIGASEHLYHFGYGRRRCPGESLAKSFIFLTFVGIMQKYKIECNDGVLPSPEPVTGLISSPKPYIADFIPRK